MPGEVVIANKFATDCAACDEEVEVEEGVAVREHARAPWRVYCKNCGDRRGYRVRTDFET